MSKYKFTLDTAEKNDSHMGLASRIKPKQRILELGCASGYLSEFLKQELHCYVVGVDLDKQATEQAAAYCDQVIVADLDQNDWLTEIESQQFDVVLCADVLEHLKNPVAMLAGLKPFLTQESRILASVPNVAHASIRLELLQGHFDYETIGLLDDTHLHFYTRDGLISMFMQAGYLCSDIGYSVQDLADEAITQHLKNSGLVITDEARELLRQPDAVAYQFIVEAIPVKNELVQHLPQPLSPKPLVSSGVFYGEKQEQIVLLKQQLDIEKETNIHHQKHVSQLEEQIENLTRNHSENLTNIIQQHDEQIHSLEGLLTDEKIHNSNNQINIKQLEEKVVALEHNLQDEVEHNTNHQNTIEAWRKTTTVLDDTIFDFTKQLQIEQEKNEGLSAENVQLHQTTALLTADTERLESVLQRVHNKISYRLIRGTKNIPGKIKGLFRKSEKPSAEKVLDVFDYHAWLAGNFTLNKNTQDSYKQEILGWKTPPKIAVLMPVYNPAKSCLINAIESVLKQSYENFELCIADDASTENYVQEVIKSFSKKDPRIKVVFREQNGHISAASNSALALVEADYVALMDHDDLLTEDAIFWIAKTIIQNPDAHLIYSDEDKMDIQGNRYAPYFKPDWNPELFLSHNFICHLGVYKTESVRALGGFDSDFDGAQDYDLALRYVANLQADQIIHIPRILYHWRAVDGSTANGVHEKPYAEELIAKAVNRALLTKQRKAEVIPHNRLPGALRVKYSLPENQPLVSIIIPTRNGFTLLSRCIESILELTEYTNYELIVIDNGSDELVANRYLQRLQENAKVTVIRDDSPFNYAAINNKAVAHAKGEIIALLNNDLEVINGDWLDEMVSHVVHPEVGAVGAKLYYPNDTIQHAGVIVGLGGVAGHSHKHFPREHPGFCGRLVLTQNLSAVTAACMLLRKEVFDQVSGFDEKNLSVAFNDVDLCLRIKQQGYDIVWTPYAEMYHYESATRGYEDTPEKQQRFSNEVAYMKQHWGKNLLIDPAYNPNLTLDREDFSFAWPPRIDENSI